MPVTQAALSRLVGKAPRVVGLALADQVLLSGTSFASSVLLARGSSTEEYGAYVLALTLLMLLNLFQSGLIVKPMAVLGATKPTDEFWSYVSSLGLAQGALGLFLAAAAAGIAMLSWRGAGQGTMARAMLGLAVAVFFVQAQEFVRRALLTRTALIQVFRTDAVSCGLQVVLLGWLFGSGILSAGSAFLAMAIAAGVGTLVGRLQAGAALRLRLNGAGAVLRESLRFGRWTFGTGLAWYGLSQANILIATAFLGLRGPAILEAARIIVAPTQILLFTAGNVLPSIAARRLQERGGDSVRTLVRQVAVGMLAVMVVFALVVSLNADRLLSLFYGGQYVGHGAMVQLYAVGYVLANFGGVFALGLESLVRPHWHFALMGTTGGLGILMCTWATWRWGLYGLAIAGLFVEASRCLGNWRLFEKAASEAPGQSRLVTS